MHSTISNIFSIEFFISWLNNRLCCAKNMSFDFLSKNRSFDWRYIETRTGKWVHYNVFFFEQNIKMNEEMSYFMYKVIWLMMMSSTLVSCLQRFVVGSLVIHCSLNLRLRTRKWSSFYTYSMYCICSGW